MKHLIWIGGVAAAVLLLAFATLPTGTAGAQTSAPHAFAGEVSDQQGPVEKEEDVTDYDDEDWDACDDCYGDVYGPSDPDVGDAGTGLAPASGTGTAAMLLSVALCVALGAQAFARRRGP